ncbi:MAG: glutaredoxin family protein [Candidatus Azambacteria bacterium]|nr:glutaredoxin family protein [Candidatus Azambacteria bacterium]
MTKILIYTTPACIYCQMAKKFFKDQSIAYEEKDVSVDNKAREEMVEKSGQLGAPVIDIDGKIIVGFDKEMLSKLLNVK